MIEIQAQTHFSLIPAVRQLFSFLILFIWCFAVLPACYNFGSAEFGCPLYEMRTGNSCFSILE